MPNSHPVRPAAATLDSADIHHHRKFYSMIRQMTDVTDLNNVLITETIREQKVYVAFPGTCVRDHTAERAPTAATSPVCECAPAEAPCPRCPYLTGGLEDKRSTAAPSRPSAQAQHPAAHILTLGTPSLPRRSPTISGLSLSEVVHGRKGRIAPFQRERDSGKMVI